jgi:hypothetical protein
VFLSRLLFFLALSAIILGARAGAASPAVPEPNPADVICGLSHGKDAPQYPAGANAEAASLSEALWKGAAQSAKSRGATCPLHLHSQGNGGADCLRNHAGLCCPTGSSDGAVNGKEIDIFTQTSYGAADILNTAMTAVSRQTFHHSHQSGPDPRPPAV